MSDTRVNIVTPSGEIENFDPADAQLVLSMPGFREATEAEISADLDRQEYGDSPLTTFAESAVGSATLGLSDIAAKAIAPGYAEGMAKRRRFNAGADMAGKIAGAIGSSIAIPGTGLLANGARALTAPGRAAVNLGTRAAELVATGAAPLATTGVLGAAAASGLKLGVAGAVEGAVSAAAMDTAQEYLTNHEITADRILSAGGTGLVWGGALGGAMGIGGGLITGGANALAAKGKQLVGKLFQSSDAEKNAAKLVDDVSLRSDMEARTGVDADGFESSAVGDERVLQQAGAPSDDQLLAQIKPRVEDPVALEDKIARVVREKNADDVLAEVHLSTSQRVSNLLDNSYDIIDDLRTQANLDAKPEQFLAHMKVTPANPQRVLEAGNMAEELVKRAQALIDAPGSFNKAEGAGYKRFYELSEELQNAVYHVRVTMDPNSMDAAARIAGHVDKYKFHLGQLGSKTQDTFLKEMASDAYHVARNFLENEDIVGIGAATMQRELNAHITAMLDFDGLVQSSLMRKKAGSTSRSRVDPLGGKVMQHDPGKVSSTVRKVGDFENSANERALVIGVKRKIDAAEAMLKAYNITDPGVARRLDGLKQQYADSISGMRDVAELRVAKERHAGVMSKMGMAAAAVASAGTGIPVTPGMLKGAVNAAAYVAGAAPGSNIRGLFTGAAHAEQSALEMALRGERRAKEAAQGVIAWVKRARDATARSARATARSARATAVTAAKAGPMLGATLNLREPETTEEIISRAQVLADPNSGERSIVRANVAGIRRNNPLLADALEMRTQRVADFLLAKAGELSVGVRTGDPFGDHRKPRHSPLKAAKLARYADAALNPQNAMQRISDGTFTREDVEALQELYPTMYSKVVTDVLMELGSVDFMPSYETRLKLGHMLNAPTDPSMLPGHLLWLQSLAGSSNQAQAEKQAEISKQAAGKLGRQSKLSGMMLTRTQEITGVTP